MFFAPALRKTAVAPATPRASDFGFERFLNDTFGSLMPQAADLQEDEKSWTVTLDVPGVARKQLQVSVTGNRVEIQSDKEARRQVRAMYELPSEIDVEKSEARLEDGVLTLKLAKAESAMARRIAIS